jgi:hypothetical protein
LGSVDTLVIPAVLKTYKITQIMFQTRYAKAAFETTWFEKFEKSS